MRSPQINFTTFQPEAAPAAVSAPLVMLHGWGHSLIDLHLLGELLGETGKVYLLDLPGFGKSPEPGEVWGTAEYADAVFQFMDQQGLAQADLFGHSFGGRVSIQMAATSPERIRRLILCNSAGLRMQPTLKKRLRIGAIRKTAAFVKTIDKTFGTSLFQNRFTPRFGSADYKRASGMLRSILVRTVNEDLSELLPAIRSETLLLWGSLDTETPIEAGRSMRRLIPQSELIELENHGHEPFRGVGAHLLTYYTVPFLERGCPAIAALRGERCLVP